MSDQAIALAFETGLPFVGLRDHEHDPELDSVIPPDAARFARAVPLSAADDHVRLAVADPDPDLAALEPYLGDRRIELAIAPREELDELLGPAPEAPPESVAAEPVAAEPVAAEPESGLEPAPAESSGTEEEEPEAEALAAEPEPLTAEPEPLAAEAEAEPEAEALAAEAEAEPEAEPLAAEAEPEPEAEPLAAAAEAEPEAEPLAAQPERARSGGARRRSCARRRAARRRARAPSGAARRRGRARARSGAARGRARAGAARRRARRSGPRASGRCSRRGCSGSRSRRGAVLARGPAQARVVAGGRAVPALRARARDHLRRGRCVPAHALTDARGRRRLPLGHGRRHDLLRPRGPSLDIVDVEGLKEAAARRVRERPRRRDRATGPRSATCRCASGSPSSTASSPTQVVVTNGSMQADAFLFDELVAAERHGHRREPDLRPHAARRCASAWPTSVRSSSSPTGSTSTASRR